MLDNGSVRAIGPPGRVLRQFPASPGRQHEQGVPLLTQAHPRHFAVPLHRQHRRGREGAAVDKEADNNDGSVRGGGSPGGVLWQFPNSPGRQHEQEVPLLTQAHPRHFAVPLHRQLRHGREGAAVDKEAAIYQLPVTC